MAVNYRTKLLQIIWIVLGTSLGSLGCQAQVSYSLMKGPGTTISVSALAPPASTQSASVIPSQVASNPSASRRGSEIVQTSGQEGPENGEGSNGEMPMHPGNEGPIPTELAKVSLPAYVIEPPDILLIDPIRMVPKPPYRLEPFDQLVIQVGNTLPDQPIAGVYQVTPDGVIILGYSYGSVRIGNMSLEEAEQAIRSALGRVLQNPQVSIALREFRGLQQTRGEHLVRPDGTLSLGAYGCVFVAGMTLSQAKCVVEEHLKQFMDKPQVALDVLAYNSKVYYVILDGGGFGQQVYRFPITGNETVLDAIGNINGLPSVASRKRLWVARPSPAYWECDQVLPVDWLAITEGGSTATNYQLFPGDRIYVKADALITLDNALAKLFSPIERIFGITLLGSSTINSIRNSGNNLNSGVGFVTAF